MTAVTCVECNNEVPAGSALCPECGFPFDSLKPIKCPKCQKMVVFSSDNCPECGLPYASLGSYRESSDIKEDHKEPDISVSEEAELESQGAEEPQSAPATLPEEPLYEEPDSDPANNPQPDDNTDNDSEVVLVGQMAKLQPEQFDDFAKSIKQQMLELEKTINESLDEADSRREILLNIQGAVATLTVELSSVATSIKESNSASLADLSSSFNQAAAKAAATMPAKSSETPGEHSDTIDYVLYICLVMLLMTILNIFITVYAVRLIK